MSSILVIILVVVTTMNTSSLIRVRNSIITKGKYFRNLNSLHSTRIQPEEIFVRTSSFGEDECIENLLRIRPHAKLIDMPGKIPSLRWHYVREGLQMDSLMLEPHFLGKSKLSSEETARLWQKAITTRLDLFNFDVHVGEGGKVQMELDAAMRIVHRCLYLSRSYQLTLPSSSQSPISEHAPSVSMTKSDQSPVTAIDFAVQAIILDFLQQHFPQDKQVAEEAADMVRSSPSLTKNVLDLIEIGVGERWDEHKLHAVLDGGGKDAVGVAGDGRRAWVLDPIDGTKSYLKKSHYCIALSLVSPAAGSSPTPVLSILACPNLSLQRCLSGGDIAAIDPPTPLALPHASGKSASPHLSSTSTSPLLLPVHDQGCVMWAVKGGGAFVKSSEAAWGVGYEATPSSLTQPPFRLVTSPRDRGSSGSGVVGSVVLDGNYPQPVPLGGQCKQAAIGVGAADGAVRMFNKAKSDGRGVWDHLPGALFVLEAGGEVTDLQGNRLEWTGGRAISNQLEGVVMAGNKQIHKALLDAVNKALR